MFKIVHLALHIMQLENLRVSFMEKVDTVAFIMMVEDFFFERRFGLEDDDSLPSHIFEHMLQGNASCLYFKPTPAHLCNSSSIILLFRLSWLTNKLDPVSVYEQYISFDDFFK
jgi:hypothetical protein